MYCSRELAANRMSDVPLSRASRLDRLPPALAVLAAAAWWVWSRQRLGALGVDLGFPLDDSWIHLQFARNLAAGAGLAYRPPEWVAGSTAPLWTALLAVGSALGAPVLWARLLGIACLAGAVEVTRRLGLRLGLGRSLAWLAAAATALTAPLVWGALSGLEIPLFTLLSLLGIYLHLGDRNAPGIPLSLPVLSLAVLARPEGWLLLGLAVIDRLLATGGAGAGSGRKESSKEGREGLGSEGADDESQREEATVGGGRRETEAGETRRADAGSEQEETGQAWRAGGEGGRAWAAGAEGDPGGAGRAAAADAGRVGGEIGGVSAAAGVEPARNWSERWRSPLSGLGVGTLVLVPVCLFSWAVGGSPFPSTLAAKSTGWRLVPDPDALVAAWGVLARALPLGALLAVVGVVLSTWGDRGRRVGRVPAAWVVGLPVGLAMIESPGGPLVGNFGRYLFPLLPLVAVLGMVPVQALADRVEARGRRLVVGGAALLLLVPALLGLVAGAGRFARNVFDVEASDGAMARWLAPRLPPEAVLGVHDVGRLGYELPNPLVDLAGILDADVREALRRGLDHGRWQEELLTVLARRRPDYLVVFPRFVPFVDDAGVSFRRLHEVEVPGNITMGDDRLAVYATPWTRHPLSAEGR